MGLTSAISKINSSRKVVFLLICVALLASSLVGAAAVEANPIEEEVIGIGEVESEIDGTAPTDIQISVAVSPVISYQGRLLVDGQPFNGAQIILFELYDTEFGGVPLWQEIGSVTVNNGLFTHPLGSIVPLSGALFDQQLWLQIQVAASSPLPRQKLMASPYAMGVVAGGSATGWVDARAAFTARNLSGTGLEASSDSARHPALKVVNTFGGPLISAWGDGEKGLELDKDGNLWIKGKLTSEGSTTTTPSGFPAPDWDSGWLKIGLGETKWIPHTLGGDPDNYFVDFSFRQVGGFGQTIHGFGGLIDEFGSKIGIYYKNLDGSRFIVIRHADDPYAEEFRIRIWRYEPSS